MNIQEIRLNNYRELLRRFANSPDEVGQAEYGRITRFASRYGVNARYLSHINRGRKNPGEDLCRQLESSHGLPHGWMDHNHLTGAMAPEGSAEGDFVELALKLYRQSPQEVQNALLRLALGDPKR